MMGRERKMLDCALASMLVAVACRYLVSQIAKGFSFTLRESIFSKIADFGKKETDGFSAPSLTIRVTNDVARIRTLSAMGLQILVKAPINTAPMRNFTTAGLSKHHKEEICTNLMTETKV